MKKIASPLLEKFTEMSGDKKIRIAMELSEVVRKVQSEGAIATKTQKEQWKLGYKWCAATPLRN